MIDTLPIPAAYLPFCYTIGLYVLSGVLVSAMLSITLQLDIRGAASV